MTAAATPKMDAAVPTASTPDAAASAGTHDADPPAGAPDAALPPGPHDAALAELAPALARVLDGLGVATRTVRHPPAHTVDEARALRGAIAGAHTKNLFLKDRRGQFFLVVALEDAAVDLKTLHARIGASGRLSFAKPEEMRAHLGVEPGAATAFAVLADAAGAVRLVVDAALASHDIWNCHPLVNHATTSIARDDIRRFFLATGHEPILAALDAPPAASI